MYFVYSSYLKIKVDEWLGGREGGGGVKSGCREEGVIEGGGVRKE